MLRGSERPVVAVLVAVDCSVAIGFVVAIESAISGGCISNGGGGASSSEAVVGAAVGAKRCAAHSRREVSEVADEGCLLLGGIV